MPTFSGREAETLLAGAKLSDRTWYSPLRNQFYAGAVGNYHQAAIVTDISTIPSSIILSDVIGLARPDYTLDSVLTPVRSDQLVFSVDVLGTITGSAKNQPLVEPEFASGTQSRVNFDLWKNQVLIAIEDKAAKSAAHDLMRLYEQDAAKEIARMRNSQIADTIEAATNTNATGHNWDTMTTKPYNDYNPFVDIHAGLENLYDTGGYKADWITMHPVQYDTFIRNTFVTSYLGGGSRVNVNNGVTSISLPGWPDLQIFADVAETDGHFHMGSKRCGILATGPTEAVQFRNEIKGYTGYLITQWLEPKLVDQTAIYEGTGV